MSGVPEDVVPAEGDEAAQLQAMIVEGVRDRLERQGNEGDALEACMGEFLASTKVRSPVAEGPL